MKKLLTRDIALLGLATTLFSQNPATAGTVEPSGVPTATLSTMYSTEAVYNRLHDGETGTKRSGAFTEPDAGPADATGKTMDEIMAVAPETDPENGATRADVVFGKTYWSLQTDSTWGLQAGTRAPAPVPQTGQASTSTAGDDGSLQKGVALPNPRFTDNGDGTVTDNLTGLVWLKNANCATVTPNVWATALTAVASLHSGDCSLTDDSVAGDWRVPNIRELASLVNDQYAIPALSNTAGTAQWTAGAPFSTVQASSNYWSSTTYAASLTKAWYVNLGDGGVSYNTKATNSYKVWPVRDGQ